MTILVNFWSRGRQPWPPDRPPGPPPGRPPADRPATLPIA